jgi:hypothetical protein
MPSQYSVVRYVPDPIADERINVGVVVFGEGMLRTKFIRRWSRLRGFGGGEDTGFLRDFVRDIEHAQKTLLDGASQPWTAETLKRVSARWKNSIQLSEPRASLDSPDDLLRDAARTFLRDEQPRQRGRDRRTAASIGAQSVTAALRERGIAPGGLVKRKAAITGRVEPHTFDLVVANGKPFFAAEGLSFESADPDSINAEIEALAWAVDDVKKELRALPVAILALPPRRENAAYRRAEKVFTSLKANFVPESDVKKWAELMARRVPKALAEA